MGTKKTWLLARESVYWINMNTGMECAVKQCTKWLEYQLTQPQEKALHYKIPCKSLEVVGAAILMVNGKTLLCTVDYHSKFPILKKVHSLSADDLVQMAN